MFFFEMCAKVFCFMTTVICAGAIACLTFAILGMVLIGLFGGFFGHPLPPDLIPTLGYCILGFMLAVGIGYPSSRYVGFF